MEAELNEMLDHSQSNFWQLVGYKGTGKSSVIRGCFGLYNESGVCKISGNTLFVYCSFNGVYVAPNTDLAKSEVAIREVVEGALYGALLVLRKEHAGRNGEVITEQGFYDFVLATKADILGRYYSDDAIIDPIKREIDAWKRGNRLTYRAVLLKYELSKLPTNVLDEPTNNNSRRLSRRQLVILFDDLEGITEPQNRRALVAVLPTLFNCLRNGVDFPAKFLVAHRPHSRDEFIQNGVWPPITIDFISNLTLSVLIKNRADQFVKHVEAGRELSERSTWTDSYRALWRLLTQFGAAHQEIVLALSNFCFRDSLRRLTLLMQQAAASEQLSENSGGSFVFSAAHSLPRLSPPKLLEMIGKRGHDWFVPEPRLGLVNIFENEADDTGTDLMMLLLLHWAKNQTLQHASRSPKLVDFEAFKCDMRGAAGNDAIGKNIEWAIKLALRHELFDAVLDHYDPTQILHHMMPRAEFLYDELGAGSALMELFLQDVYLDETQLSNFRADRRLPFLHTIRFCDVVADTEMALIDKFTDKQLLWDRVLRRKTVSKHAFSGLKRAWERWEGERPQDAARELTALEAKINAMEVRLDR